MARRAGESMNFLLLPLRVVLAACGEATRVDAPAPVRRAHLVELAAATKGQLAFNADRAGSLRALREVRIVDQEEGEVSAALTGTHLLGAVMRAVRAELAGHELPAGYALYDGGALESLQHGQVQVASLAALAPFLVFVVMAVQYESLRHRR
jgi:hypothetical protein